ncbi:MAG: GNAT family N-acetyltransferase [Parvibaculum sp.]
MTTIEIIPARPEEKSVIANLLQLYIHDFTDHWTGEGAELGDDGRFAYPWLDSYWRDAGREPLIFRAGGRLAGFALLNKLTHSGLPADWNMAEFFIARKYRRGGAGTAAAHAIFTARPGLWEAAVMRTNTGALPFWRKAAAGHPLVSDVEELDVATGDWNGPILRFRIGSLP